jgi:hypothetical protein
MAATSTPIEVINPQLYAQMLEDYKVELKPALSCMSVATDFSTETATVDVGNGSGFPGKTITSIIYLWSPSKPATLGLDSEQQQAITGQSTAYHGSLVFQTADSFYYVEREIMPKVTKHDGDWEKSQKAIDKAKASCVVKMRFTLTGANSAGVDLLDPEAVLLHFQSNNRFGAYVPTENNCQHFVSDFLKFYLAPAVFEYGAFKDHIMHEFAHLTKKGKWAEKRLFPALNYFCNLGPKETDPHLSFAFNFPVLSFKENDIQIDEGEKAKLSFRFGTEFE